MQARFQLKPGLHEPAAHDAVDKNGVPAQCDHWTSVRTRAPDCGHEHDLDMALEQDEGVCSCSPLLASGNPSG